MNRFDIQMIVAWVVVLIAIAIFFRAGSRFVRALVNAPSEPSSGGMKCHGCERGCTASAPIPIVELKPMPCRTESHSSAKS